jgi:tRNA (guanosine-2'-O-)-methyltransferase
LFEAQRQRSNANLYAESRLDKTLYDKTLFEWAHPAVAEYCQRLAFEYPQLNEDGDIVGPFPRSSRSL